MNVSATLLGELLGLILFITPLILSLMSKHVDGYHKIIWFLMSFFLSWIGFLLFYFTVVKSKLKQINFSSEC